MKATNYLIIIVIFFSSCAAYHSGYMLQSGALTQANFKYVARDISGSASCTYVFGIGGLATSDLIHNAKLDLLRNYNLRENQATVNLTVNFRHSYDFLLFVVSRVKCTITADVVEFATMKNTADGVKNSNYNYTVPQTGYSGNPINEYKSGNSFGTGVQTENKPTQNDLRILYEERQKAFSASDYDKAEKILFKIIEIKYGSLSAEELEKELYLAKQNQDQSAINEISQELRRRKK